MIYYKDMTFCVNQNCKNKCRKFLTHEIEQAAKHFKVLLAVTEYICLDKGEDGVYKHETEET